MTMTNEQLEEAVVRYLAAYEDMVKEDERKSAERRAFFSDFEFVTSTYKKLPDLSPALIAWRRAQADSVLIIRQLWEEREGQRAKPVEVGELMDTIQPHAHTRDIAQAILSRYNVTKKGKV